MIICSCNVLSDHAVRAAATGLDASLPKLSQIYRCLGCSPQCGRCAATVKRVLDTALGSCRSRCATDNHFDPDFPPDQARPAARAMAPSPN